MIGNKWDSILNEEYNKEYFKNLIDFIKQEYKNKTIYPKQNEVHKDKGWEIFTDNVIKTLNKREKPVVFILWGAYARAKKEYITNPKHYIIESAHPSPFSARNGFFGSKPFSKTNEFLKKNNIKEIDWRVE